MHLQVAYHGVCACLAVHRSPHDTLVEEAHVCSTFGALMKRKCPTCGLRQVLTSLQLQMRCANLYGRTGT